MPLSDHIAKLEEVADAIGRRPEWLRRNWLRIHQRFGFPRKHPTGMTWPRAAVDAWLIAGGFNPPAAVPLNDNLNDPAASWQAAVDARYGGQQ